MYIMASTKRWTIATARQHLPAVIRAAAREPQRLYRRDKLVAVVVSPSPADQVVVARRPKLAERFAELQRLCGEESYELSLPVRRDRSTSIRRRVKKPR